MDVVREKGWREEGEHHEASMGKAFLEEGDGEGAVKAKSILPRDEPASWQEGMERAEKEAGVEGEGEGEVAKDEEVEAAREKGERMMANEGLALERYMRRHSPSDARWLAVVRKSGTTK